MVVATMPAVLATIHVDDIEDIRKYSLGDSETAYRWAQEHPDARGYLIVTIDKTPERGRHIFPHVVGYGVAWAARDVTEWERCFPDMISPAQTARRAEKFKHPACPSCRCQKRWKNEDPNEWADLVVHPECRRYCLCVPVSLCVCPAPCPPT